MRRDLAALEEKKKIVRSHGGASKVSTARTCLPINFRKTVHHAEKRKLCAAAAKLCRDKDVIFVDASTSAQQISEFLESKRDVTVVTNSIPLAIRLKEKGICSYTTGGEIKEDAMCFIGSFAEEFIRKFNFDIMFFSCKGVSEKGDIVDVSLPENNLRRCAMQRAEKSVFICDSSKLFQSAPFCLSPLSEIDYIITDDTDAPARLPSVPREKFILITE